MKYPFHLERYAKNLEKKKEKKSSIKGSPVPMHPFIKY